MTYAFSLDASACSGCKACQEACKDKNGSPPGVLLRRVVEVSGGEWRPLGKAWESDVFAYYLSLACNHCIHPKCAGVCPTDAFDVRLDGIVTLEAAKCMGCGYCAWACPYGAPQYDPARGVMLKCDFCCDKLDAGLPPTCVAACPLRVLDYGTVEGLSSRQAYQDLWHLPASQHPYPLPEYSRTEPNLAIKPHPAMSSAREKVVSNREELHPPASSEGKPGIFATRELPLVVFTLLSQMAVGLAVWRLVLPGLSRGLVLSIGSLIVVGGLTSFLHLGVVPGCFSQPLASGYPGARVHLLHVDGLSAPGCSQLEYLAHSCGIFPQRSRAGHAGDPARGYLPYHPVCRHLYLAIRNDPGIGIHPW